MIDILDRANVFAILNKLQADDQPQFGMMTPQHMVEHLAFAVRFSNGKEPQAHHYATEKEQKIKANVIGTDYELPIGFRSPVLPVEGLSPLMSASLPDAMNGLKTDLKDFDHYFDEHPTDRPVNPVMGEMNYQEWVIFHNKHFTHHFKQFRLL